MRLDKIATLLRIFALIWIAGYYLDGTGENANSNVMELVSPQTENQSNLLQETSQRIYQAAQKQAHYLLSTIHPWEKDTSLLLLTESRSQEHWIRPNTNTIAGFAFLYRFGEYDEEIVGISRDRLLHEKIIPMIRYITTTHKTGNRSTSDGKKWGDAWQSAHWAHMLGRGCWWIWNELPDEIKNDVQAVVRHEAERFVGKTPPSQIKNDTKAEENAWNSQILSVAILLMPDDPHREQWEEAFQTWALSSYLRPADQDSNTLVDGKPVHEQFTGANIYNDFTLENHGFIHPDYMTTFTLTMGCLLDYRMTQREAPEAIFYNVPQIYENLKWFSLPDGGFVYPNGQDWRLFRNPDWLKAHLYMAMFTDDPDAWSLAMKCLNTLEKMQARSPKGAIYQEHEYFFASTQHDIFYALAQEWLMLQYGGSVVNRPSLPSGVREMEHGEVILNRTPMAIHTLSWGAEIMAQCVPYQLDRIVSPHTRNGIGSIQLMDKDESLPVAIHDISVSKNEESYRVEMELDHGKNQIRAYLKFQSNPDGSMQISEKLVALDDVKTENISTGLIGILNNESWVYENGIREIAVGTQNKQKKFTVVSRSGESINLANTTQLLIDDVYRIQSKQPFKAKYIAAQESHRARVTDRLYLNCLDEPSVWQEGETISEYYVDIKVVSQEK